MKHKWIIGIIIIVIILAIIAASSVTIFVDDNPNPTNETDNSTGILLKVIAQGPWDADITDGSGYDSIFNEGNATYDLKDNSTVSVTISKTSSDNGKLEAQLIKDGKIISNQSTDDPLGTITVHN